MRFFECLDNPALTESRKSALGTFVSSRNIADCLIYVGRSIISFFSYSFNNDFSRCLCYMAPIKEATQRHANVISMPNSVDRAKRGILVLVFFISSQNNINACADFVLG